MWLSGFGMLRASSETLLPSALEMHALQSA